MRKLVLTFLLILSLIGLFPGCSPSASSEPPSSSAELERDQVERTVYVTNTGKRYHRENCRYLAKSKIPIKLKDALAQGYTPCHVCRP